jgi:hypothetical protein
MLFVLDRSIIFFHLIILICEVDFSATFVDSEYMNSSFVRRACNPVRLFIEGKRVYFGLVGAAADFLDWGTVISGEKTNQGALVTRGG